MSVIVRSATCSMSVIVCSYGIWGGGKIQCHPRSRKTLSVILIVLPWSSERCPVEAAGVLSAILPAVSRGCGSWSYTEVSAPWWVTNKGVLNRWKWLVQRIYTNILFICWVVLSKHRKQGSVVYKLKHLRKLLVSLPSVISCVLTYLKGVVWKHG